MEARGTLRQGSKNQHGEDILKLNLVFDCTSPPLKKELASPKAHLVGSCHGGA